MVASNSVIPRTHNSTHNSAALETLLHSTANETVVSSSVSLCREGGRYVSMWVRPEMFVAKEDEHTD